MCTLDHSIEPRPCARAATRFVTFSCLHRNHWLAHPETRDAVTRLISDGAARGDIRLHAWVIMSNHIHLLATDANTAVLAWTARLRKRFALHEREQLSGFLPEEARAGALWLRGGGHSRMIWSWQEFVQKCAYIHTNPVRAKLCDHPSEWKWSSALDTPDAACTDRPNLSRPPEGLVDLLWWKKA